jgi:hypothetical protein
MLWKTKEKATSKHVTSMINEERWKCFPLDSQLKKKLITLQAKGHVRDET